MFYTNETYKEKCVLSQRNKASTTNCHKRK